MTETIANILKLIKNITIVTLENSYNFYFKNFKINDTIIL